MKVLRILATEWPSLLLPLVPLAIFAPALFGPWVFWQRDISLYWYPQAEAFVRVVSGGSWPLWNPYTSFGLPLLADPSAQALYPFTWLNLLVAPETFYKAYTVFHVTGAGMGLYFLMRRWGLSRLSSLAGAAVWMASGPLLVVVSHYHHLAGTAWLPWVLLALDAALTSATLRASVLFGAAMACQLLAGSGDLCLMAAFASAGYVAVFLVAGEGAAPARARASAMALLTGGASAALLSAAQWLPTLAILHAGQRLQLDASTRMYWSLHPASLLDLWVPRLINDMPVNGPWRAALFESRDPLFSCVYMGAGGAAMAVLSLPFRWSRFKVFAAAGLGFSILTALGRHAPLYPLLVRVTPLFLFRYPEKYVVLAGFFWALLVGMALEDWVPGRARDDGRRWLVGAALGGGVAMAMLAMAAWILTGPAVLSRVVEPIGVVARELFLARAASKCLRAGSAVACVALLAWLRGRRPSRAAWTAATALAVVLVDLGSVGAGINPLAPPQLMKTRPALADMVAPGSRIWVSMSKPNEWLNRQVILGPTGWEWQWWSAAALRDMAWPPSAARWGLRGSFDGDFTGLAPPLLGNLTLILRNAVGSAIGRRVLQIGGVDYVVGTDDWPTLEEAGRISSTLAVPIRLYRVPETLPSLYVVRRTRVVAEPASLEVFADPSFDPALEVVVPPGTPELTAPPGPTDRVRQLWHRADSLGLEVDTGAPAYVVALQAFHAGWRARVDDQPAPIARANVLFQAVRVDAGHHRVVLEYRPPAVLWGAALSGLSAILGLAALVPIRRRGSGPVLPSVLAPQ